MFSTLFDFPSYLLVDWRSSACRTTVFSSPFLLLNECIHTIWDAMKRNIFAVNDDDDDMMQVHPFFFQFQEIISKNKTNPADKLSCKRS